METTNAFKARKPCVSRLVVLNFWFSEASPVGDDWQPSAAQEERHADFMGTVDFKAMLDTCQ